MDDREDAYAVMKVNLRAMLECCAQNGIYLGVEPHGPYTAHKQSMLRIMELQDSPWLKVNFDTGNSYLAGEDPYEFLEAVRTGSFTSTPRTSRSPRATPSGAKS